MTSIRTRTSPRSVLRCVATLAALAGSPIALTAQDWVQNPASGPQGRQLARLVHDSARNETVMFGGYSTASSSALDDTWTFDGTTWTQKSPATVPPRRDTYAMAYDSTRNVTTLFGGVDSSAFPGSITNQTWEWNGVDWTQRMSANAPSPRFGSAMAFDVARGVQVLFGGSTASGYLNETWEWNGVDWTQRTPATSPPPRTNMSIVYDVLRARIVLFGGTAGSAHYGDTWEFDGSTWTQVVTPLPPPGARRGFAMAYDLTRGVTVVSQGLSATGTRLNDTWEFDGSYWHQYRGGASPAAGGRVNVSMAFDLPRRTMVLFGGAGSPAAPTDTWELVPDRPSFTVFGRGCGGTLGLTSLDVTSLPAIGGTFTTTFAPLQANAPVAWLIAGASAPGFALFGSSCELRVQSIYTVLGGAAVGATAALALPVPNDPTLSGLRLFLQGAAIDATSFPLGLDISNGARAIVR